MTGLDLLMNMSLIILGASTLIAALMWKCKQNKNETGLVLITMLGTICLMTGFILMFLN